MFPWTLPGLSTGEGLGQQQVEGGQGILQRPHLGEGTLWHPFWPQGPLFGLLLYSHNWAPCSTGICKHLLI